MNKLKIKYEALIIIMIYNYKHNYIKTINNLIFSHKKQLVNYIFLSIFLINLFNFI